jgi:lysophospholipase L1-like esterase
MKKYFNYSFLVLVVLGSVWTVDFVFGRLSDLHIVRESARQFRSEAAPLEISTRALLPGLQHRYPGDEPRPEGADAYRYLRTDARGLIQGPSVSAKDTLSRILFLGGSTTESNEVDESLRFPALVASHFSRFGQPVLTMNGGVRGNTTADSINALLNRPDFRTASIVVLMENINDRLKLAIRDRYETELGRIPETSGAAIIRALGILARTSWDWVVYRSNMLFVLEKRFSLGNLFESRRGVQVNEKMIDFTIGAVDKHLAAYRQNLEIFVSIVRVLGAEPVLMTQALGVASVQQTLFNDEIRRVATSRGVRLIDIERRLGDRSEWAFFEDKIHLNNDGSRAVGQIVFEVLAGVDAPAESFGQTLQRDMGLTVRRLVEECKVGEAGAVKRGAVRLLPVSGRYPSFSPDGRFLLYQTFERGFESLRLLDIFNGNLISLSGPGQTEDERHPVFFANVGEGIEILFGAGAGSNGFERLNIREWPTGATRALDLGALGGAIPAVDEKRIVFPGFMRDGPGVVPNLYQFDRMSGEVQRLAEANTEQWRPAISKTGDVYFIGGGRGRFDIFRLRQVSGAIELFERSPADEWDPAVSPDGQTIAFASRRDGSWDIFLKAADPNAPARRLTSLPGDEWDPSFHPDAPLLVYAAESAPGARPFLYGTCLTGYP